MDLFGSSKTLSLGGKKYSLVIINDYTRLTWVYFLAHKDESFENFKVFCKRIQNKKSFCISAIRSDHGREFENVHFENYCRENRICHNFPCLRTPQQNRVMERKYKTLQEMARMMFFKNSVLKHF